MSEESHPPEKKLSRRELSAPLHAFIQAVSAAAERDPTTNNGHPIKQNRRDFIKTGAMAVTAAATASIPALPAAATTPVTTEDSDPHWWVKFVFRALVENEATVTLGGRDTSDATIEIISELGRITSVSDFRRILTDSEVLQPLPKEVSVLYENYGREAGKSKAECKTLLEEQAKICKESVLEALSRFSQAEKKQQASEHRREYSASSNPLAIAIYLANVPVKWDPSSKRLTLQRPPLDALFDKESKFSEAEKLDLRNEAMRQLGEIAETQYPGLAKISRYGITLTPAPRPLLAELGIDPAKACLLGHDEIQI